MQASIQFVTVEDGSLAVSVTGQGPTLVALPAGPWGTLEIEESIGPLRHWYGALGAHVRVVRYDQRGIGYSTGAPDFSLAAQVIDLAAVAAWAERSRPIALFAPQTAGPAALAYASRFPARVSRVILWCTFARGADYYGAPAALALRGMLPHDVGLFTEAMTHDRLGWATGAGLSHELSERFRSRMSPETIHSSIEAMVATDVTNLLSGVQAPVLVLQRRALTFPSMDVARRLTAALPNARLVLVDGDSVAPFLGNPQEIRRLLLHFLGIVTPERESAPAGEDTFTVAEPLSAREQEVLALIAEGLSNQEMANRLVLTVGTVKTHVRHIFRKLDTHNRTQAVARGRERGWL